MFAPSHAMKKMAYKTEGSYFLKGKRPGMLIMFQEDRTAMIADRIIAASELRNMESDYGILPFPKYAEDQDGYFTTSRVNMKLFGIPADVEDTEFAGLVTEALSRWSVRALPLCSLGS